MEHRSLLVPVVMVVPVMPVEPCLNGANGTVGRKPCLDWYTDLFSLVRVGSLPLR